VPAQKTVNAYNAYMQGIDRHDQLRVMFKLTKRHGFKKWYVETWLALIEIDSTNASICYFLANPDLKKKEDTVVSFIQQLPISWSRKAKHLIGKSNLEANTMLPTCSNHNMTVARKEV
jgi:hypothetical protein